MENVELTEASLIRAEVDFGARVCAHARFVFKIELEFRVSEKGGVSVYGLGRFPVTLYYETGRLRQ